MNKSLTHIHKPFTQPKMEYTRSHIVVVVVVVYYSSICTLHTHTCAHTHARTHTHTLIYGINIEKGDYDSTHTCIYTRLPYHKHMQVD